MANAILNKPDGRILCIPTRSIFAYLSTALDPVNPEREGTPPKSYLVTTFKGVSLFEMADTAVGVEETVRGFKEAKKKALTLRKSAEPEMVRLQCGDDYSLFPAAAIEMFEQKVFKTADGEDDPRIRVNITYPDGTINPVDITDNDYNLHLLTEIKSKGD